MPEWIIEWFKIGTSGFLMSLITWWITRQHYKKQMSDQIFVNQLGKDVYKPLLTEYNRILESRMHKNTPILDIKLISKIISSNKVLLKAAPSKITKNINVIYSYCSSPKDIHNFEQHSEKIISALGQLQKDINFMYEEFSNDK